MIPLLPFVSRFLARLFEGGKGKAKPVSQKRLGAVFFLFP